MIFEYHEPRLKTALQRGTVKSVTFMVYFVGSPCKSTDRTPPAVQSALQKEDKQWRTEK